MPPSPPGEPAAPPSPPGEPAAPPSPPGEPAAPPSPPGEPARPPSPPGEPARPPSPPGEPARPPSPPGESATPPSPPGEPAEPAVPVPPAAGGTPAPPAAPPSAPPVPPEPALTLPPVSGASGLPALPEIPVSSCILLRSTSVITVQPEAATKSTDPPMMRPRPRFRIAVPVCPVVPAFNEHTRARREFRPLGMASARVLGCLSRHQPAGRAVALGSAAPGPVTACRKRPSAVGSHRRAVRYISSRESGLLPCSP